MLQALSKYGYTCAARLLFGPDIDSQDVHYARRTALINTVENNSPLLVKILITAGANLDLQDWNGNTALMFAVRTCNEDLVKMLIAAGANLDLQNNEGNTALMFAIYSTAAIVKILIEAGANVNSQNIPLDGRRGTALMHAIWREFKNRTINDNVNDIVEMLINAGTNLELQNQDGITAIMLAMRGDNKNLVKILVNAGADIVNIHKFNFSIFANKYKIQEYLNIYRAQIDNISSLNYLGIDPFIN